MAANFNVCLNEDAKTGDIIRYLEQAVNDDDLAKIVSDIVMQGKSLFGRSFAYVSTGLSGHATSAGGFS